MEPYIVIALIDSANKKDEKFRIIKADQLIPEGYKSVHGPTSLDACTKWITESFDSAGNWFWVSVAQYALIFIVTLVFVVVIVLGASKIYYPLPEAAKAATVEDTARIFITFLVAVGTIAIALLAVLTAMIIREYKERFALAKEVLTVLVGILGTIVGFYFGSAKPETPANSNSNVNGIPNANPLINGNNNSGNPSNGNTSAVKNSNTASISHRQSGGQRTSLAQNERGEWKVVVAKL
jgi:hypothetical protein